MEFYHTNCYLKNCQQFPNDCSEHVECKPFYGLNMDCLQSKVILMFFILLKSYGAEALGDIRVDLLPCVTPPNDPTVMSPQDPPTIMNISSSGNSKFCFLFFSSSQQLVKYLSAMVLCAICFSILCLTLVHHLSPQCTERVVLHLYFLSLSHMNGSICF